MHRNKKSILSAALLLALATPAAFAANEVVDKPDARRQALQEWYNEAYPHTGAKTLLKSERRTKDLFPRDYQRFLQDVAKRERARFSAQMPRSTSATVVDPEFTVRATADGNWTNIGPTKADYTENGATKLNVTDAGRVRSIVTDPTNPNTLYIAFSGGGVWKSTDGGAFWNAKTETLGSLSTGSLEIDPRSPNTLYLGLGDPFDGTGLGVAKTTDGGDTWSDPVLLGDSTKITDIQIAPTNSSIVLVATNQGLYRSTNAGVSYTKVAIATGATVNPYVWSIASTGGSNLVLSLEADPTNRTDGTKGQIWRSTDNGGTWTLATGVEATVGRITVAAAPSAPTTLYAIAAVSNATTTADLADLLKSTDGGATWTGIGKSGGTYKAYTNGGTLDKLLGGQGWYNHAIIVDPTNPNVAYFGGQLSLIQTTDGGGTFKRITDWLAKEGLPYVHADFHAAHFASNGTLYAGTDGGIARSTDKGATWTHALNEGIATHKIYQIGSSPNNRSAVIAGLQDNGTRVRVGSTGVFNQELGGDGFGSDINQANANLMLGSLYYTRIYKSTDGGLNFRTACTGIPECGNANTAPFVTRISRWRGDASGNTQFTYSNTKVYKTTNYADSWTALGVGGLPTTSLFIRNVSAAPSDVNTVGLVANAGAVFLTTDGGTNWTRAAALPNSNLSLSSIAFDPIDRNIVYVSSVAATATHNHLWRSTDFGQTWTAIDAGGFPTGIPVNQLVVHPSNRTTLYAATHLGVYHSTNSGQSWSRFGTSLPLVNVTDLYVSADDSLIRAATYGRSVWELSGGGGGENKPPVASFKATVNGLTVNFSDASTDSDGTIASRAWNFGDNTGATEANPAKTYPAPGNYTVTLTVTDDKGAKGTASQVVTVQSQTPGDGVLVDGKPVVVEGAQGSTTYFTMDVKQAANVTFSITAGTGDADLYVRHGSKPTLTSYDCRPYQYAAPETCSLAAKEGTYHVMLVGYRAYSNVSLLGKVSVDSARTYANETDVAIVDRGTVDSPIVVSGRTGNGQKATAVTVAIDHTYIGDLKVELVAPSGKAYVLHNRTGGATDDIRQIYTVDLSAEPLNGSWKLRVNDAARNDTGTVERWAITF